MAHKYCYINFQIELTNFLQGRESMANCQLYIAPQVIWSMCPSKETLWISCLHFNTHLYNIYIISSCQIAEKKTHYGSNLSQTYWNLSKIYFCYTTDSTYTLVYIIRNSIILLLNYFLVFAMIFLTYNRFTTLL